MDNITLLNENIGKLKVYKGDNAYLHYLKNYIFIENKPLTVFQKSYLSNNIDKTPFLINKIVKIAPWYGEKLQEKYSIEFTPKVLQIGYYLGECESLHHMYIKWRQSQDKMELVFVPKNAILTDFLAEDFNNLSVDFDKYNKIGNIILTPQQEKGTKFLLTRKKGILSLDMGMGKSICSIVSALEGGYNKVLIVSPASVKTTWKRELLKFVSEDEITIVEGSKWRESKFTIINYDILDNFYVLPTETVKRKVKEFDDNGNISWKTIEKEQMSRKSEVINEAMENSQLFQSNFDLIIIDEIHRLSNNKSGRYKVLSDLIKRTNPSAIFGLTGTIITNNPLNMFHVLKIIGADITNDWQYYMKQYCGAKSFFVKKEREGYTKQILTQFKKNSWYDLSRDEKSYLNDYLEKHCKKIWTFGEATNLDELAERIKHLYLREESTVVKNDIKREIITLDYTMNDEEQKLYDTAWDDYVQKREEKGLPSIVDTQQLIECSVLRQVTAKMMIPHTIELAKKHIENDEKVIIACAFDSEVEAFKEYFGDIATIYNGKLTAKQKDKNLDLFLHDDNCKVFIGNIIAAGVGLTILSSHIIIFNSVSFVPADNVQFEYRIVRLGQKEDCKIYYQKFLNTYQEHIFELLNVKNQIIKEVIKPEEEK